MSKHTPGSLTQRLEDQAKAKQATFCAICFLRSIRRAGIARTLLDGRNSVVISGRFLDLSFSPLSTRENPIFCVSISREFQERVMVILDCRRWTLRARGAGFTKSCCFYPSSTPDRQRSYFSTSQTRTCTSCFRSRYTTDCGSLRPSGSASF